MTEFKNDGRIKLLINYGYEDTVKILEQNGYFPVSNFWFE